MRKVDLIKASAVVDVTDTVIKPVVPMPEPVKIPAPLKMGPPDKVWLYRQADGSAYAAVARWDSYNGKKEIRPIIWDGKEFITKGLGPGRPLLNVDIAASQPLAPILIVEGEKTLDAAYKYTPDGWIVMTWAGGASAWKESDWTPLAGRRCVIWPDNDAPGLSAALNIQTVLAKQGCPTSLVKLSSKFPEGWDLADELPVGTPATITALLTKQYKDAALLDVEPDPIAIDLNRHQDEGSRYRALGHKDQVYYILPYGTQTIHHYTAKSLMTKASCMEIVNDDMYWEQLYGYGGRIDWVRVGSAIMKQCQEAKIYSENKIRGIGVWSDRKRTILHLGNHLYVDGQEVSPSRLKSDFIYPERQMVMEDWAGMDHAAPDEYGRLIRAACNAPRWESPMFGDLLAGWIATAIICGGIPWRTHCWVTGNQGSGKSTVVDKIVKACLGEHLPIFPVGNSTEAGIRQTIGNTTRPIVFDEAENQGGGGRGPSDTRQAIIQLMRQSSSDGVGQIMKGSASHEAVSFSLRSAFFLSSIGVGLKEAADLSRTVVLTLRPLDGTTKADFEKQNEEWQNLLAAVSRLPADIPHRLLARQVANINTIIKNIETFKQVISENFGNRRLGDQLGTLMAGCHSLYSSSEISKTACKEYISRYDLQEFTTAKAAREDLELLHHIAGHPLRVQTSFGVQNRVVGELIDSILNGSPDDKVPAEVAEDELNRTGIRVDRDRGGVWLARGSKALAGVMISSPHSNGWDRILLRNPSVVRSTTAVYFKERSMRALFVPKEIILSGDE